MAEEKKEVPKVPLKGIMVPDSIAKKVDRAREAMKKDQDIRRQCVKFFQNEPYWYIKAKGGLGVLPTALDAVDKQSFRIRKKINLIPMMVQRKVSAATQRVPGYEVDPSSTDPDDISGARLAQQVAFYGHDKWRLRRHTTKSITNALVQREGFLMPYFDQNVGPFTRGDDGQMEGQGEVKFLNLSRSEVGWEPGMDFEDSPWYVVIRAMLTEHVQKLPGFVGGEPTKNAESSDVPEGKRSAEMTELVEFFERPCPEYPEGRYCVIADKQIIVNNRKIDPTAQYWWQDYPYRDAEGKAIDEPCLHRISYTVNIDGDDMGLVEMLIDPCLTVLDCWNKILEMKNRALMLQMMAPRGSGVPARDDTPGTTTFYNVIGGQKPEWEPAPDPQYLAQLREILEVAKGEMRAIAGDIDIQPEPDLAAKTLNAAIEQAQAQWQVFLGDVAEFHSRVMRHCLTLVAAHYDRERIVEIRGQYGWEPVESFKGADLNSQVNVRVLPGSIEAKTRTAVLQELEFIQTNWPGAISPEVAVAALHGNNADGLFRTYDLHVARAWGLVQKIRNNFEEVLAMPSRQDLELGDPTMDFMVPGWMPRKQDNLVIWKQVIADYMITPDFEEQGPEVKHMFDLVWEGLEYMEEIKLQKIAMQEQNAAAELGSANAAKPQGDIASPAVQGGNTAIKTPEQAAPAAGTPE